MSNLNIFYSDSIFSSTARSDFVQDHYNNNIALEFSGFIEDQFSGNASKIQMGENWIAALAMFFGADDFVDTYFGEGYNACGWVAIYNALITLGDYAHPADIVSYLELNGGVIADGMFGTDPTIFGSAMENFGYKATTYLEYKDELDKKLKAARTGILCIQNSGDLTAHNINLTWEAKNGVYIMHNSGYKGTYKSLSDFLTKEKTKFISLTIIQ